MLALSGCGDDSGGRVPNTCDPGCAAGEVCQGGTCVPATGTECTAPEELCGGACVDTTTSTVHCGGCGIACLAGDTCTAGACSSAPPIDGGGVTPDAARETGTGTCVGCDPERSDGCGGAGGGGPDQCLCGTNPQCPIGQACVLQGGASICSNTQFDPNNCGGVGIMCGEGETCNAGSCVCASAGNVACAAGQACCSSGCVDIMNDDANCGGCDMLCLNGDSCTGGSCGCGGGPSCRPPMAAGLGGDGDLGQSCCDGTCVENTNTSCACESCTGEDMCQVLGFDLPLPIPLPIGGDVQVCCTDEDPGNPLASCGDGGGFPLPF